jgi:hypothetical protein
MSRDNAIGARAASGAGDRPCRVGKSEACPPRSHLSTHRIAGKMVGTAQGPLPTLQGLISLICNVGLYWASP